MIKTGHSRVLLSLSYIPLNYIIILLGLKVGYVVEGRNYRKYRVEERTPDGFIVGEYGVLSHDDGSLRGVRYTADGTINPRLIYDALMKFLAL